MNFKLNKRKLLWVLSGIIDLVGVTDLYHGKRVAYIAKVIASSLSDFPWSESDIIIAGMLHDCGVSSNEVHENLLKEMEWSLAQEHCTRGEMLLSGQKNLSYLAKAIGLHHTRWEEMIGNDDELLANLIFLADRVDVLAASASDDILISCEFIVKKVAKLSNTLFSPNLVSAFINQARKDEFWLDWQVAGTSYSGLSSWINNESPKNIYFEELKELFILFSACVDGKSTYTYNHSLGVAALAVTLARFLKIGKKRREKLYLAGLLHDIGKLRVPDIILEKKDSLNSSEFKIMRHHSYDTRTILSQIENLDEITLWAGQHHEKLNASGYPTGIPSKYISLESRILTVADILQALIQDRPYRQGLSHEEILPILDEMVANNEIDKVVVEQYKKNYKECTRVAKKPDIEI